MTSTEAEDIIILLGNGYSAANRSFDWRQPGFADLYRDILAEPHLRADVVFETVKAFIFKNSRAPDLPEMRLIVTDLLPRHSDADAYRHRGGPTPPGHALRLMTEGAEFWWAKNRPGKPFPEELRRTMERLARLRDEQRANWRPELSEEGFAARPNIVLDAPVKERELEPALAGVAISPIEAFFGDDPFADEEEANR